jgi:hypothetical protein
MVGTWKVTRHGFDNGASSHPSEIDLDGVKFDYEILVNDGELDPAKERRADRVRPYLRGVYNTGCGCRC